MTARLACPRVAAAFWSTALRWRRSTLGALPRPRAWGAWLRAPVGRAWLAARLCASPQLRSRGRGAAFGRWPATVGTGLTEAGAGTGRRIAAAGTAWALRSGRRCSTAQRTVPSSSPSPVPG
eukprot:scaffold95257_cov63-Phaeocystis_antarctica.AAC.2